VELEKLGKRDVVEAILFVSREPISARKLASLAELDDPTEARTIARQLNELYDSEQFAYRIEEVAGGMQILTRPQFSPWLRRLELVPAETVLSASMLETLAIIAYRQPVARSEIEAIRGVGSDEALRQLMQRNLVRIEGRSEDLGRAYLYGTTKQFLQLFGLQSLDFLPRAQKIREAEAEIATRISIQPTMSTSSREVDAEPGPESEEKIVP
jgi:segregation and condensation protein B